MVFAVDDAACQLNADWLTNGLVVTTKKCEKCEKLKRNNQNIQQ